MRFVFESGGEESELELRQARPDASVGDLAAALEIDESTLHVDGRPVAAELGLHEAGLINGSTVSCTPAATVATAPVVAQVIGGLDAGLAVPLRPGRSVVGRDPSAEVPIASEAVSRQHCVVEVGPAGEVTLRDLGSSNGTDLNGERISGPVAVGPNDVVTLGGVVAMRLTPGPLIEAPLVMDPIREARPGGVMSFSRAPRPNPPALGQPVSPPTAPPRARKATFSLSMILSPLLMAGVMIVMSHDVRYAAISGLTPLMFLANTVEERTRGRRSVRRGIREFNAELERFGRRLRVLRDAEVARRRTATPDITELLHRAEAPTRTLWERRADAPDFLRVAVAFGTVTWQVPVETDYRELAPETAREIEAAAVLPQVPVTADLSAGCVVGLEGDRDATRAVARALLCQALVGSGPADVHLAIFTDADRAPAWEWTKWLPHLSDHGSGESRRVAVGQVEAEALAKALLAAAPPDAARLPADGRVTGPLLLVVVDGATLLEGRPCPLREVLAGRTGPTSGIVLTDRLPALCTTTVAVRPDGTADLRRLSRAETMPGLLAIGVTERRARRLARSLARFEDPELRVEGAGLPDTVTLLPLLGLPSLSGAALRERWREGAATLRAGAVLGVTEDGLFRVDLDDDGPHGLIAGTTGSGKSELLRTLIAGLAVGNDPEHLTFALIDYKGGGALDECARLPHSVGLVTDLDEQLSQRALRCLEAELHHRERLLRDVGLSHIRDYQTLRDTSRPDLEPMPRLVVVIDEFATLVKALPRFVDSLVSVAQLGRSLGIHLIMATQRPAGAVSDAIKNNVKLRIALRLESAGDSTDVIDDPIAAAIGGRQRGRAFYRVSAREVLPVQTALSTGVTTESQEAAAITVTPFTLRPAGEERTAAPDGPTDLQRLVAAAAEAQELGGFAPPRRPWPEPLPAMLPADDLPDAARGLMTDTTGLPALALADDPDRQARYPVGWDPAAGNMLVYGAPGYGTTSALATLALAVGRTYPPDAAHVFVLDMGAGELAPLAGLPHVGAYLGPAERERQNRLIRTLRRELDSRKASGGGAGAPSWLVLIDNLGAFLAEYLKDTAGMKLVESLERVYADGPTVGIRVVATADRAGAVPGPWAALTQQKLLMRLADPGEYGLFDVARDALPAAVPGRAVVAATKQMVHLAWHGDDLSAAVIKVAGRWPGVRRTAPKIGLLPERVPLGALRGPAATPRFPAEPTWLPVGMGDEALAPVALQLYEHEHALIAGPPRSGRSTALCTLAAVVSTMPEAPAVLALAVRRSPLRESRHVDRVVTAYDDLEAAVREHEGRPILLLVDDADAVDDSTGVLGRLAKPPYARLHIVAAGRADTLRRTYGHWTQQVRESRCGVLLMPDYDLDGDLLGAALPRLNRMLPLPGRGFLVVGGGLEGVQVAVPE